MPTLKTINGKLLADISRINGTNSAAFSKINGIDMPGGGTDWQSTIWDFDTQTPATQPASNWSPSAQYATDGWVNGLSAVNGSNWTGTTLTKGWNSDLSNTPSGTTGPNGGMNTITDGTVNTASTKRYLYKECTSNYGAYIHVFRTPGFNYSTEMDNTLNDLNLVFWIHGFGSNIPATAFQVWIDTATSSNSTNATLLQSIADPNMANGDVPWSKQTISLNAYRTINAVHYIYVTAPPASSFRGDVAVDTLYFEEV